MKFELIYEKALRRVAQDPDVKDKKGTQPKKYYKDMPKSTKDKRDAHFKKGAKSPDSDPDSYKPAPGDAKGKTKPSKHTKKFKQMFGDAQNRIPRKKGQHKGSSSHSDLYTDEDPEGTIHGLGFKDAETARKGIAIVNKSDRTHAHKVQATLVMQQRAKVAIERTKDPEKKKNLKAAYEIWTKHLDKLKEITKKQNEDVRKMPDGGYGVYADKFVKGKRVMTPGGKHAKELKKVYKNKKDANDYMAAIMIAKGGG